MDVFWGALFLSVGATCCVTGSDERDRVVPGHHGFEVQVEIQRDVLL